MPERRPRKPYLPAVGCIVLPIFLAILCLAAYLVVPLMALNSFGPASPSLGQVQVFQYSLQLLWYDGLLTTPADPYGAEHAFTVAPAQGARQVAEELAAAGLVRDADAFVAYLVYSGLDTLIQSGEFTLSPALTPMQIAARLQDATPTQITFVVLPGWRLEEIAASLPTSGLAITPEEFLSLARNPPDRYDFLPAGVSAEGFLLPGSYKLPRAAGAEELLSTLMNQFALELTSDMRAAFASRGLDVYQAVTLASIVQREAVMVEEQPTIASVFYNRLGVGMKLETDPTVQYAVGYDAATASWWKVPLSLEDLQVNSPYNTYLNPGLPPGPISNPALSALQAVAYPAQTPYYFFRARCDGSRLHNFSETFDQHLMNACP
jgi:UPF0755 protein